MNTNAQGRLRRSGLGFSGVLGLLAVWLFAAELPRPAIGAFPTDPAAAAVAAAKRNAAAWAARLAVVRGDLWVECAETYADLLWRGPDASPEISEFADAVAERAAASSPHDARGWLLLAGLDSQSARRAGRSIAALKMAYYTAPNEFRLTPMRLLLSLRASAADDAEIRQLTAREIRTAVIRRPEWNAAVAAAYRAASPAGKRLVEATLEEADPTLLAAIRAASNRQP